MNAELFMVFCLGALTCAMGCMVYNHRRAKTLVRAGVEPELRYHPRGETAAEIQELAREIADATNNHTLDVHLLGLRIAKLVVVPDKPEAFYRVLQIAEGSARHVCVYEITAEKKADGPKS